MVIVTMPDAKMNELAGIHEQATARQRKRKLKKFQRKHSIQSIKKTTHYEIDDMWQSITEYTLKWTPAHADIATFFKLL